MRWLKSLVTVREEEKKEEEARGGGGGAVPVVDGFSLHF